MKTASWWLSLVASGMTVLLCFCGASGGSTLFTLGNPYIMEIPRCLIVCMDMGIPVFWLRCALQPFVIKLYLRPTLLWESTPMRLADCWASSVFGWRNISGLIGNLFCVAYSIAGLLELFHGQAINFGNTVWAMFLDEYPWRSQVALNPEVELLRCMCKRCSYIKA